MSVVLPGVLQFYEARWSFNAGFLLAKADITGGTKWNSGTRDVTDLVLCVRVHVHLTETVCNFHFKATRFKISPTAE